MIIFCCESPAVSAQPGSDKLKPSSSSALLRFSLSACVFVSSLVYLFAASSLVAFNLLHLVRPPASAAASAAGLIRQFRNKMIGARSCCNRNSDYPLHHKLATIPAAVLAAAAFALPAIHFRDYDRFENARLKNWRAFRYPCQTGREQVFDHFLPGLSSSVVALGLPLPVPPPLFFLAPRLRFDFSLLHHLIHIRGSHLDWQPSSLHQPPPYLQPPSSLQWSQVT